MRRALIALVTRVLPLALAGVSSVSADVLLQECRFDSTQYCSENPVRILSVNQGLACGQIFRQIRGRLTLPPLVNAGPIRIELLVLTPDTRARFPLYVGIVALPHGEEACRTDQEGFNVFAAQALVRQCGGIWETVGPIDLTEVFVPIGNSYSVQLEGFHDGGGGSVLVAAIRVFAGGTSVVEARPWTAIKEFYR